MRAYNAVLTFIETRCTDLERSWLLPMAAGSRTSQNGMESASTEESQPQAWGTERTDDDIHVIEHRLVPLTEALTVSSRKAVKDSLFTAKQEILNFLRDEAGPGNKATVKRKGWKPKSYSRILRSCVENTVLSDEMFKKTER